MSISTLESDVEKEKVHESHWQRLKRVVRGYPKLKRDISLLFRDFLEKKGLYDEVIWTGLLYTAPKHPEIKEHLAKVAMKGLHMYDTLAKNIGKEFQGKNILIVTGMREAYAGNFLRRLLLRDGKVGSVKCYTGVVDDHNGIAEFGEEIGEAIRSRDVALPFVCVADEEGKKRLDTMISGLDPYIKRYGKKCYPVACLGSYKD